jgi:hypothetical protein
MRLARRDAETLAYLRRAGSVWSIVTTDETYASLVRLRDAGLVQFDLRIDRRGAPQGHDIYPVRGAALRAARRRP